MSRNAAPATKSHSPPSPKCCPCHEKSLSWLIVLTFETSLTMRGATWVTLQLQQKLRLPRKLNLMINPPHVWSVIYIARSNKSHPPPSANTAPHEKRTAWLIRIKFQTSFTLGGPRKVTLQTHQVLRLPWNSEFKISAQNPWIASARPWSDDNPTIKSSSHTRRFGDLTRPILEAILFFEIHTTFRAPAISQNVTTCCACHKNSHSTFTTYCACHEECTLLFSSPLFFLGIYSLRIYSLSIYSLGIYSLTTHLVSKHLFSKHLVSKHLFSREIFSKHLFSKHLVSEHLVSKHLFSKRLVSKHLFSKHLVPKHLFPRELFSKHLFSEHLFSKQLFSKHLVSKHLFSNRLFAKHLFSKHLL